MSMTTKIELTPPFPVGTKKWALMHGKAQEITVVAWDLGVHRPKLGEMHIYAEWRPMHAVVETNNKEPVFRYIPATDLYDTAEELKAAIFDA